MRRKLGRRALAAKYIGGNHVECTPMMARVRSSTRTWALSNSSPPSDFAYQDMRSLEQNLTDPLPPEIASAGRAGKARADQSELSVHRVSDLPSRSRAGRIATGSTAGLDGDGDHVAAADAAATSFRPGLVELLSKRHRPVERSPKASFSSPSLQMQPSGEAEACLWNMVRANRRASIGIVGSWGIGLWPTAAQRAQGRRGRLDDFVVDGT